MSHLPPITRIEFHHGFVHSDLLQQLCEDLLPLAEKHPFTFAKYSTSIIDAFGERHSFFRVYSQGDGTLLVELRRLLLEKYQWAGEIEEVAIVRYDNLASSLPEPRKKSTPGVPAVSPP